MKKTIVVLILLTLTSQAMARKPLIGISASGSNGKNTISDTYVRSVEKAGGVAVILPQVPDSLLAVELLKRVDGVIFSGGEDVAPAYYGEEVTCPGVKVNEFRDRSDLWYARAAIRMRKPILGICRGEQLLNVALGGSLYQDIPTQVPATVGHRQKEKNYVATQWAELESDSRLARLLGTTRIHINSFHHQAVKRLAPGLRATARTEDGIVEAYEGFPRLNILAVQFHPEGFVRHGDDFYLPLFKDLVKRSR